MNRIPCATCGAKAVKGTGKHAMCADCAARDDQEYQRLLDYLRKAPYATLMELHTVARFHLQDIRRWLDEGKVALAEPNEERHKI